MLVRSKPWLVPLACATFALNVAGATAGLLAHARRAVPAQAQQPEPPAPRDRAPVPAPEARGLVVLFSGKESEVAANWLRHRSDQPAAWKVVDGAMVTSGYNIVSKEKFTDFQLHVEFKVPYMPDKRGQSRGNSGVGLQERYEIQILDSYGIEKPGKGDCGALYSQAAPLVNACRPPREWQTYDISFRAPRFDAGGSKTENGRVTVVQNGVVVLNNQEITGTTGIAYEKENPRPGPIYLQFHNNTVEFRNVWVLPLPEQGSSRY